MQINIVKLVAEYGVKNIRFIVPMTRIYRSTVIPRVCYEDENGPSFPVECEIFEGQYIVANNYKISLRAIDEKKFGYRHFYISDLEMLVNSGSEEFKVYTLSIDGYKRYAP